VQREFNSRIAAQRAILGVINQKSWRCEQLFGLSSKAIDRWAAVNGIDPDSRLAKLLRDVSAKLFFLANRSQDQVSSEYTTVSTEIIAACDALKAEVETASAKRL
jgi:hypothetical protein